MRWAACGARTMPTLAFKCPRSSLSFQTSPTLSDSELTLKRVLFGLQEAPTGDVQALYVICLYILMYDVWLYILYDIA